MLDCILPFKGRYWPAFLTVGARTQNLRSGAGSESQEALRTAGQEAGAMIFVGP